MGEDTREGRPWTPDTVTAAARRVLGTSAPTDPFSVAVLSRAGATDHVALSARNDDALRSLGESDLDAAVERLTDLVLACEAELGAEHPDTLTARGNLAMARLAAGEVARALTESVALLADRGRVLGADHPGTVNAHLALGLAHLAAGDSTAACTVLDTALSVLRLRRRPAGRVRPDPATTTCVGLLEIARGGPGPAAPARRSPLRPGTVRPDTALSGRNQAWGTA